MTTRVLPPPPQETRRAHPEPAAAVPRARPVISPARGRRPLSFGRGPLALSLLLHAAAFGVILLLRFGPSLPELERVTTSERVEYVDLTWPTGAPGDGAGAESSPSVTPPAAADATGPRRQPDAAPLAFPRRVPNGIPAPGSAPASGAVGERGVGGTASPGAGGVGERLRPGFRDSRLYVAPGTVVAPEKTNQQKYMEHLTARIEASNDSVEAGARTPNTDWTVSDANGGKWGLSEKGLHLGSVTIPNALIPKPGATGTNQKREEARTEQQQRDEIRRQEEDRARREAREESIRAARERANAERQSRAGATN